MNRHHHGLSVGIEAHGDLIFVVIKAIGKLTHDDYRQFTPMLESALAAVEHPQIKLLFDASEFDGWELHAAWDDLRIGLKHGKEFTRIALYGQRTGLGSWQEWAAKIGSWFIAGRMEAFSDKQQALLWLSEN